MTKTPEEKAAALEKRRKYDREYKRKQRLKPDHVESKDRRTAEQRRDENRIRQQEYRAKKKAESEE